MPFTPLHLGPGAAFKGLGAGRFSFLIFAGTQVLMDIEPLLGMLLGWPQLHGPSHTLLGALFIGLLSGMIGKPLASEIVRRGRYQYPAPGWGVAFFSAFIGTYSHIVLDAIMHADMQPWWPLSQANPLLGLLDYAELNWLCLGLGITGLALLSLRGRLPRRT